MIVRMMLNTRTVIKHCDIIAAGIASNSDQANDIAQQAYLSLLENEDDLENAIDTPEDLYNAFRKYADLARYNTRYIYARYGRDGTNHKTSLMEKDILADLVTTEIDDTQIIIDDLLSNSELSDQAKQVIKLSLDGYTRQDIADQLGITKYAMQNLKWRTVARLREVLC